MAAPVLFINSGQSEDSTGSALTAKLKYLDYLLVFLNILLTQIAEEAATASNKLKQTATGMMIMFMNLEMFSEMLYPSRQQPNLDAGRTSILIVISKFF